MVVREVLSDVSLALRLWRWLVNNWAEIRLLVQCHFVYRRRRVRISMAYLFRIKLGGLYLLVRGNRIRDQYQPVGGVYKFLDGARDTLDTLGALSDVFVPEDADGENDLRRVLQRGAKLPAFLEWFRSRQNREIDPHREFEAELLDTGVLAREAFSGSALRYKWVRSVGIGLRPSPELEIPEYLYADIYELLPTAAQETLLRQTQAAESDLYKWVDERCIRTYGASCGIRVGSHTWKILEGAAEPPRRS